MTDQYRSNLDEFQPSSQPLLIVLSGPSGVGKDAVMSRMREQGKHFHFTVTATTRPQRPSEIEGHDYIFVSPDEFTLMVENGDFLEWAEVYSNRYGIPRAQVENALKEGRDVLIKTDVQGAATIRKLAPNVVLIFLVPPTIEELAYRLGQRMTESTDALELRLRTAKAEMREASKFDHVVTNHRDRLDETVAEIEAIISKERNSVPRCTILL